MDRAALVRAELAEQADAEKAEFFPRFFKTAPGEYGERDRFIGVTVPAQRKTARKFFKEISLAEIAELLNAPIHEHRLTALFMLVYKYEKAKKAADQEAIVDMYLNSTSLINNWDMVDCSADKILGPHFFNRDKTPLYEMAGSGNLWQQRIAIMTTFHFIRQGKYRDTLNIARLLLDHPHDLIHKAVGWMLREIGKRDFSAEYEFLREHYRQMPRTMLRYAIEKFDEDLRQRFLKGLV